MAGEFGMNWLCRVAGVGQGLSKEYRSRYWELGKRKREIEAEIFNANPPESYQEQLALDAQSAQSSLPLYGELLAWMESQMPIAQQDPAFAGPWQEAIEGTRSQIQGIEANIQDLSGPYDHSDHAVDDVLQWAQDTEMEDIRPILDQYGIEYEEVVFPKATVLRFDTSQSWVYEGGSLTEVDEWIDNAEPYEYFEPEPDDWFWQNPVPVLYHATEEENVASIQQNGLEETNETRGLANRSTGAAVFTSDSPDDIDSYGNYVFEINVMAMKADGYMPPVTQEDPIEEQELKNRLAAMLSVDDYHWDVDSDISPSTYIFHGGIPTKYLRLFE